MSGHSKWHTIKHKKAAADSKRGKIFTKLIREITVAAKAGGGKIETNPRLRLVVDKAKAANMPQDNIERAIKKGTGELPGVLYEEISYEGYGPNGVAVIVEALTDNKNRTTSEVRSIFTKKGGNMAGAGSVSWMFEKKGYIQIEKGAMDEEALMGLVIETGAEDFTLEGQLYEIKTSSQDFEKVKKAIEDKHIKIEEANIGLIPKSTVKITNESMAKQVISLTEALEDNEDVQEVYANFDIPDDILEKVSSEE